MTSFFVLLIGASIAATDPPPVSAPPAEQPDNFNGGIARVRETRPG